MENAAVQGASCSSGAGVLYFAQRHLDMQLGEPGIQTNNLPIIRRPALPSEVQPLCLIFEISPVHQLLC